MLRNFFIGMLMAVVMTMSATFVSAQQITMKAGAALGTVDSREIGGDIHRMLNVYWETNYALRIATFRFVTFGLSYLGTGGKFSDVYMPGFENEYYHVKARFNNVLTPIKFKVTTEHRKKPRLYGFAGFAPGVMFYEARDISIDNREPDPKNDKSRFDWTPRWFQTYLLVGGGVYYRHIILDIGAYVSTFKDYKEFMAPIVYNSGLMLTVGYQVSRDETRRW